MMVMMTVTLVRNDGDGDRSDCNISDTGDGDNGDGDTGDSGDGDSGGYSNMNPHTTMTLAHMMLLFATLHHTMIRRALSRTASSL